MAPDDASPAEIGVRFVTTQEAIAEQLGCDRKSIQRWQKRKDCPGKTADGYDVQAWKDFVAKNKLGPRRKSAQKSDLEAEKMKLQNERLALQNAVLRGEVCSVDEVASVLGDMIYGFRTTLTQGEGTMAEETVGVDVPEAMKRIARRHHEALEALSLGQWAQKKTFWSKVFAALSNLQKTFDPGHGQKSTS